MQDEKPEFSRTVAIDRIGSAPQTHVLEATAAECAALAQRFDLSAVGALAATLSLSAQGEGWRVEGSLKATVTQRCIATGADVPATVAHPFVIRFVQDDAPLPGEEEIVIDQDDEDVMPVAHGQIDLGEAVAQTLALALDPFPRAPDAEQYLRAHGVLSEEEATAAASPFAALKGLTTKKS